MSPDRNVREVPPTDREDTPGSGINRRRVLKGIAASSVVGFGSLSGVGSVAAAPSDPTSCDCPDEATCELSVPLCAAQTTEVGTVRARVVNTEDGLSVEVRYSVDEGYALTETHLYVGKTCPEELSSSPGQFPYSHAFEYPEPGDRYLIDFDDVCEYELANGNGNGRGGRWEQVGNCGFGLGDCLYLAAHAVVVRTDDDEWEETAWGDGCDGREFSEGGNWATYFTYTTAFCDVVPKTIFVGYEDLPLGEGNDYDYNDWLTRLDTDFEAEQTGPGEFAVSSFTIEVLPRARGASFEHEFGLLFEAGTFCDGTYDLTVYDGAGNVVSSTTGTTFDGDADTDVPLFNTGDAYPQDATNIVDGEPCVDSDRTATLTVTFDEPCPFDVDSVQPTQPHGSGLFVNPYIVPDQTGETIDAGDIRLLSIPDTWLWPLKEVPIWEVYDEVEDDGTGQPVFTTDTWFDGGFDPTLVYDAC